MHTRMLALVVVVVVLNLVSCRRPSWRRQPWKQKSNGGNVNGMPCNLVCIRPNPCKYSECISPPNLKCCNRCLETPWFYDEDNNRLRCDVLGVKAPTL